MIDPDLSGKTVFITGGNYGIGAACARAFAEQNANIFLTYFREKTSYSQETLKKAKDKGVGGDKLYRAYQNQQPINLIKELKDFGIEAAAHERDLSNPDNIKELFDLCEKEIGPVDILVNNHTYCSLQTFDPDSTSDNPPEISLPSPENIDKHFAVNSRAFALLMSEYVKRFLKRGAEKGRIINMSTDAAHAHEANINYAASKHAIESYSRSAAAELGKYGITVNIVAPGPIQTGYITPEFEEEIKENTPLRRVGKPEDVSEVVVFLASRQARWVTGQLLYVGGGWRMSQ